MKWKKKRLFINKEVESYKTENKEDFNSKGINNVSSSIVLEKEKEILQKETEIYKLKLILKEKEEDNLKLMHDKEKFEDNLVKIKTEFYENLKSEKENCKTMINSSNKRWKELRMQYESEQQLLITTLTNLGYEAYLMSQQKKKKSTAS